jgi:hypothetical protein
MRTLRTLCVTACLIAAVARAAGETNAPAANAAPGRSCPAQTTLALQVEGGTICVSIDDASPARQTVLRDWVERSARIVAQYYGHFTAPLLLLQLEIVPGAGVHGGRTTNESGLLIQASVGRDTTAADLASDWVLVHEMVHLALPEVGRRHNWLAEGLATYVEGMARAQFGNRAVSDVWAEYRHSMPFGLPKAGEGGMDETRSWGRTYWGGALFCLQADVALRQQTGNRYGLQTALRAILNETGGYGSERDIEEVLRIGDAATGTQVLQNLYRNVRTTAVAPDLELLWKRLGVPKDPASDAFDDHAPLAAIRIALTARPSVPR